MISVACCILIALGFINIVFHFRYKSIDQSINSNQSIGMKVLAVGKVCLDVINYVDGYPIEDSDQTVPLQRWAQGGNAANNCVVFSQLRSVFHEDDFKFELFGSFGTDLASSFTRYLLDHVYGVDTRNCPLITDKGDDANVCLLSTSCIVVNRLNGSRTITHGRNSVCDVTFDHLRNANLNFADYDWINFETRDVEPTRRMLDLVLTWRRNSGSTRPLVSVELEKEKEGSDSLLLSGADYFFISKDVARARKCASMEDAAVYFSKFIDSTPKPTIVCPWGDQGACVLDGESGRPYSCPAFKPERAVDTLGAGDTFFASFIFAKCQQKKSSADALKFASLVAGLKCGLVGYDKLGDNLSKVISDKGIDFLTSWC